MKMIKGDFKGSTINFHGVKPCTLRFREPPKTKWIVTIPKGGVFYIEMTNDISFWQRFWIRFIGWEVKRP